jgi:hypothetical protein
MGKHAKPIDTGPSDTRPATVLRTDAGPCYGENCDHISHVTAECTCLVNRIREWDPSCPLHGVNARVAAGVWPPALARLWREAKRAEAHAPVGAFAFGLQVPVELPTVESHKIPLRDYTWLDCFLAREHDWNLSTGKCNRCGSARGAA